MVTIISSAVLTGCWLAAAGNYQLPVGLLRAVSEVESDFDPRAIAAARDGTYSVGLMQINSSWFSMLEEAGISEARLYDPCTNIAVGAWILSQEVDRYGYSWEAIGAYYAGAYSKKSQHWKLLHYRAYATRVLRVWRQRAGAVNAASEIKTD